MRVLSLVRSRPPRPAQRDGQVAHNWNVAVMGSGKTGIWSNDSIFLGIEFNDAKEKNFVPAINVPIFHGSLAQS